MLVTCEPFVTHTRRRREQTVLDLTRFSVLTFDCYGTLIDWETGIANAMRPILERHGVEKSGEQIFEPFGALQAQAASPPYQSYRDVLSEVADGFGKEFDFTLSAEERDAFADSVPRWPAFADSSAALKSLSKHYKLAILSNVDDALFAHSARKLGVEFAEIVTAEQVGSYKPDPRNFQALIERLGLPKDQILHVAQSLHHDIAPANDSGLANVWINRRHGRPGFGATPPQTAQPDMEFPDLASFARAVEDAW